MAILEVKDLKKSFGQTEVLKGVDFSLEEGGVLALIGSSGSGKTTLLRCLNFLELANSGQIILDGKVLYEGSQNPKLSDAALRKLRLNFGLVFQQFNLFPQYNVLENVTLAAKLQAKAREDYKTNKKQLLADIDKRARDIIDRVGLTERIDYYPCMLSGGQQQRVSIARALALEPRILFFDEPTSALDPELTGEILKVIKKLASEKVTMIIVTHEIAFARDVADKIIFMDDGVIVEQGTPDQVIGSPRNERTQAFLSRVKL